jgi:hypothetical protein
MPEATNFTQLAYLCWSGTDCAIECYYGGLIRCRAAMAPRGMEWGPQGPVATSLCCGRGRVLGLTSKINIAGETNSMADKRTRAEGGSGKDSRRTDDPAKRRSRGTMDERWLERKVRDMYQEVVNEPVPDDILKILNRIPKLD